MVLHVSICGSTPSDLGLGCCCSRSRLDGFCVTVFCATPMGFLVPSYYVVLDSPMESMQCTRLGGDDEPADPEGEGDEKNLEINKIEKG